MYPNVYLYWDNYKQFLIIICHLYLWTILYARVVTSICFTCLFSLLYTSMYCAYYILHSLCISLCTTTVTWICIYSIHHRCVYISYILQRLVFYMYAYIMLLMLVQSAVFAWFSCQYYVYVWYTIFMFMWHRSWYANCSSLHIFCTLCVCALHFPTFFFISIYFFSMLLS